MFIQARQSNIQEQVKEKADRVNLDEIPSGSVGIDAVLKTFIRREGLYLKEIWVVMTLILIARILVVTLVKMKGNLLGMMKW